MNKTTDQLMKATELRDLHVKFGEHTVEEVESLAYDHPAARVTGVHLKARESGMERRVPFSALDLSRAGRGELTFEPPVSAVLSPEQKPAIESFVVHLPSGQSAHIHDAWIKADTGEIVAYEVGLHLKNEQPQTVVRVTPAEINHVAGRMLVTQDVEARLREATGN